VCSWWDAAPDSSPFLKCWKKCASSGCHACRLAQLGAEYLFDQGDVEAESWIHVRLGGAITSFSDVYDETYGDVFLYTRVGSNPTKWPGIGVGREIGCQLEDYSSMVAGWLSQNHSGCPQNINVSLSARLLDVQLGESNFIRLVATSARTGTYAALSHCWGGDDWDTDHTTQHCESPSGHSVHRPAKNFQDAVSVTREIGLQYLWIDALCIIQDDPDDWEAESGNMATIYQNAHLVIGANMSPNSEGGFLENERLPYIYIGGRPVAIVKDENAVIFARSEKVHYQDPNVYDNSALQSRGPLSKRAWTLQESLLASRMVNFQYPETVWRCDSVKFCECGRLDSDHTLRKLDHFSFNNLLSIPKWSPKRYKDWYRIVQEAAARNITNTSDMLPCVSDLAQRFYRAGAGTYLAGLWLEDLPLGLLWQPPSGGTTAVAPYRGPSWSWISVARPSYANLGANLDSDERFNEIYLEILEAECKPKGQDPFGEVSVGCSIKVSAPMLEIRKDMSGYLEWDLKLTGEERSIHTTDRWFHVRFDDRQYEELSCPNKHDKGAWSLFVLFVGRPSFWGISFPNHGLVLKKRPDVSAKTYERVGVFEFSLLVGWDKGIGTDGCEELMQLLDQRITTTVAVII